MRVLAAAHQFHELAYIDNVSTYLVYGSSGYRYENIAETIRQPSRPLG